MRADKPFSASCERNRAPIVEVLLRHLGERRSVLEIGSGTGQHAVHFAQAMPWLSWQCSDRREYLDGIRAWLDDAGLPNTPPPIELDVTRLPWSTCPHTVDAVFSANTLHIMSWAEVEKFFAGLDPALAGDGTVVVYGPFNYGGSYTSISNREFDGWLKHRDAQSGIRDFESVDALASTIELRLIEDVAMPANNRCLVWRR